MKTKHAFKNQFKPFSIDWIIVDNLDYFDNAKDLAHYAGASVSRVEEIMVEYKEFISESA